MPDPDNVESLEAQIRNLRSSISDLGCQLDSDKTKTAAALGAGVFLLFLAAMAAYDLGAGKGSAWLVLGVTRETLAWIASGLGVGATLLLVVGFRRAKRPDTDARAKLDLLESEYAELVKRRNQVARSNS